MMQDFKKKEQRNKSKFQERNDRSDDPVREEVLQVRRVSTKRTGGSSFHFSVLSVAGDFNGRIGVGLGKSLENTSAIAKSKNKAKKSLVNVYITKNGSIPHELMIKNGAVMIFIKPAPAGAGIIAGGSVRKILEFAGYKNISVKIIGSSNPVNNANTLVKALTELRPVKKNEKVDNVIVEKIENE